MICDLKKNAHRYKGISEQLDKALDIMCTCDYSKLETGKNEIDGGNLFVNVMEYDTKDAHKNAFEAHKVYLDIHTMITGKEMIAVSEISFLSTKEKYSSENDCELLSGRILSTSEISSEHFLVCFPEDGHVPGLSLYGKVESVKKAVFKVKL